MTGNAHQALAAFYRKVGARLLSDPRPRPGTREYGADQPTLTAGDTSSHTLLCISGAAVAVAPGAEGRPS
jgi:hypothetical protein